MEGRKVTLHFQINVGSWISIGPGKAGKNNKHRPSNKHRPRKILRTNKGRSCDVRCNDQKYSSKDQF